MSDANVGIPVLAGLAMGIALIVLFSAFTKPTFTMLDEEIRQKVRKLPEVDAFNERYVGLETVWRDGSGTYVEYQIGRTWLYNNDPSEYHPNPTKQLRLTVKVDSFGRTSMILECLGHKLNDRVIATVDAIKTTQCIEQP